MRTLFFAFHKNRRNRVIPNFTTNFFSNDFQSFVGVFDDEFFTENIDKMFGASSHHNAVGVDARKPNGIPNLIAPKPCICGNNHGIIFPFLNFIQRNHFLIFSAISFHWDELIKNPIIQHQHQFIGMIPVLNGKKPFRGIVSFIILKRC